MKQSAIILIFLLLFPSGSAAQTTSGSLVGTVTYDNGSGVGAVTVVATETNTNQRREAVTASTGTYSISNLPPGSYRIQFQKEGFKTHIQNGIEIRINESSRFNAHLEAGSLGETVNVEAPYPVLQTDTSSISSTINDEALQSLPLNGRQYESLILQQAGVVASAPNSHLSNRGGFNIGGLDEHYISYFVDGFDNVDPVIRSSSYRPSIDAIQEIKLEQSGYPAEFGRNGGGVVSVTTKSGTNDLHFSFWEFLRNDNFDARNFFAPTGFQKPSLIRNQFGGTISGPLKVDRTFFFGSFEGLRQKTGQTRRATVPTERMRSGDLTELGGPIILQSNFHPISREVLGAYPLPNLPGISGNRIEIANKIEDGNDFSVRLDHRLLENTRLTGRFSRNVTHVLDPFRTETTGVSNLSNFGQMADRFRTNFGLSVTSSIGSGIVHEFRAGFNRFRQPQIPLNPGTPLQQPLMGFLKTFLYFDFNTATPLGSNAEFKRAVNVYNYMDSLSYVKGNHQIKVGVDARRYLINAYNVGPNVFFFTGARTGNAMADFLLGLPFRTASYEGSPTGNTRKFEFAAYAQDDWKVTPRLTLNYGLRWEFYGRIKERVNKQSFWVPDCNCIRIAGVDASEGLVDNDFNNFAPRVGFAWRPLGDRMVIRGSGGIFYDNDMRHNLELALNPPFFFSRDFVAPPSLSDPFPAAQSSSTLRPFTYDKKFRDTYVEQWNLSAQREVLSGVVAEVAYVGNHSVKGRRLRVLNLPVNGVLPYPGFGPILAFEQAGSSNYHALQVRVERPFSRNFGFTSAYTWGHAIDDRPGQGAGLPRNSNDMRGDHGNSDFDVRHNWTSTMSIRLPWGLTKPWGRWSVSAVSMVQGGRPFTVTLPGGTLERPDIVPGVEWKPDNQGPDHWINPAAFSIPASVPGNLGRNTLRGPGLRNLDLALIKIENFRDARLEFRAEFFNVFNHPNFSMPNNVIGPTLGLISSTAAPERQIQFGVKAAF
jgi:hypothetical protein